MRYQSLDGLRGLFLILMMYTHTNEVLGSSLGRFNHHLLSWTDAAHGFVALSGLVAGIVYTRRMLRDGDAAMTRSILARVRTIYLHHAALVLALLVLAWGAMVIGRSVPMLGTLIGSPLATAALGLAMTADLNFIDVLPMYVVLMAAAPWLLRLMRRGHLARVLMGSGGLWLVAQTGLTAPLIDGPQAWLSRHGQDLALGSYFNLLGWQLLFVGGLAAGYLTAMGQAPTRVLKPGQERLAWAALGILTALAVLRLLSKADLLGPLSPVLDSKSRNSFIYVLSFATEAFVVAWLLVAGPTSESPLLRRISRGLAALVTWRPLTFLGAHSLQAFAAHVLAVYLLAFGLGGNRPDEIAALLLLLASPAPLLLAAWLDAGSAGRVGTAATTR
ncbi:OpgC domain-containing protein [Rubellimicrobium aerolatum]|uniref:OpgC domain-containing protein n=1 Tax=Rubellimicrobium aerolatum TaxID=490979 RepID=A0ABW0SC65_9RHOB|nr:OpgC domain-containing protein [Rubellimicrobium aerolatum]MBP1806269.1 hypothetical protein [Rubellimicrobium aerolatum]